MFTPTSDYNQQLLAYLQGWRQLLEQWTAMAASSFMNAPFAMPGAPPGVPFMPPGLPFMSPGLPFTPPMPPSAQVPPAPADYTQQLFACLQAWRQYLEQMTGASPGSAQVPPEPQTPAQPPNGGGGKGRPPGPPDGPTPPGDGGGGGGTVSTSAARKGSTVTWPPLEWLPPGSYSVSQISAALEEPQLLSPPDYDFGYQLRGPRMRSTTGPAVSSPRPGITYTSTSEAPAQHSANSAFQSAVERVEGFAAPEVAPRSLFSSPGAQSASAMFREVGETPSP